MKDLARPGRLYYYDGLPAWLVRAPQPSRFKDVRMSLQFADFPLPNGGLLACILRLYDVPDQPFYVHRLFDPGDPGVAEYLDRCEKRRHWIVEIASGGQDPEVFRVASLDGAGFDERLRAARAHDRRLGSKRDGGAALRSFLAVFDAAAKEGGWEKGWKAVRKKFKIKA